MKIVKVEPILVKNPIPDLGGGTNWLFVKLTTDEGIVGWGECNATFGRERTLIQMIKDFAEWYVIGADPHNIEMLWQTLYSGGGHYMRHPGMISTQALSGIEIACWDIKGKALKTPVYNLLGGKINDKLRTYTYLHAAFKDIGHILDAGKLKRIAEASASLANEGFTGIKFDPCEPSSPAPRNLSLQELRNAENFVRVVREAVGDKADILIGTHGQLTPQSALRFAHRVEQYDPMWFEEPVPLENIDEMAWVADHTTIPIATGERLISIYEFTPLIERHAAKIIQVHVGINGLLEGRKIAALAEAHYSPIAPWMFCGPIAAAAAVQLDACSPNFLIQEMLGKCKNGDSLLVKEYFEWKDGYITVPDRPGLGIEMDEDAIKKFQINEKDVVLQRFTNR